MATTRDILNELLDLANLDIRTLNNKQRDINNKSNTIRLSEVGLWKRRIESQLRRSDID